MFKEAFMFMAGEWKLGIIYTVLVVGLAYASISLNNSLISIILFCIGLLVFTNFLITCRDIITGNEISNKYRLLLKGDSKIFGNIFILLIFFSAIMLIAKGPILLFSIITSSKEAEAIQQSVSILDISISVLMIILFGIYKFAIFSSAANLIFYNNEVLESFKAGLKGMLETKSLLIITVLFTTITSFSEALNYSLINNIVYYVNFIFPVLFGIVIFSYYKISEPAIIPGESTEENKPKTAQPVN